MWFVDQTTLQVFAGNGGNGCEAFAQPPYTRSPYPDGGNGGNGGDVIAIADHNVATLLDFHMQHTVKAKRGAHGSGNNRTGRGGQRATIRVPVGTYIKDEATGALLCDLVKAEQSVIIARGGAGGLGNANAAHAAEGQPGEVRTLRLELKLIADVGLVGFPNAGKSSLLARISTAKPKVADYPFTTRYPVLGVVSHAGREPFVACDIPGLIEGAHQGRGLGLQFLRHIERTRILVHLIDMSSYGPEDPLSAYHQLNQELALYSDKLLNKPSLLVANKMDDPQAHTRLDKLKTQIDQKVWPISCATGQGITELLHAVQDKLQNELQKDAVA